MPIRGANDVPEIYEDLGINISELGVLMLSTENPLAEPIPADAEFKSENPDHWWVKGLLDHWHATVRYGFLPGVKKSHVDRVVGDIQLPSHLLLNGHFECFSSPYKDDDYDCVVFVLRSRELNELNAALSVLPNVNTYIEYKPHITIGYFQPGWFAKNRKLLVAKDYVKVLGYDYGHRLLDN